MTGPIKADLDKRMLRTLKALARVAARITTPSRSRTGPTTILRGVVRSGLSALRVVPFNVAEAVLAHRQGGHLRARRWSYGRSPRDAVALDVVMT
jgi:hypothetical protein